MYLANGSTTNINDVTVSGNSATTGPGVFEQANARVNPGFPGLKDEDDPGGKPYNSGIA